MSTTAITQPTTFATRSARALAREALRPRGLFDGCILGEPDEQVLEDKRGRPVSTAVVQTIYDRRTMRAVGQVVDGHVTWYATAAARPSQQRDPKSFAILRRRRAKGAGAPSAPKVVATDDWPHRKP